jgi:hypothetical protein
MRPMQQTPARTHSVTKSEVSQSAAMAADGLSEYCICAEMDILWVSFVVQRFIDPRKKGDKP